MNFILCERRKSSMLESLGKVAKLVDNYNFLPMFRNRQILHPKEFNLSARIAKTKKLSSHYFAKMWSPKNLERTLTWLRSILARKQSEAAKARQSAEDMARSEAEESNINYDGLARLNLLRESRLTGTLR